MQLAAPMVTEEMKTELMRDAEAELRVASGYHAAAGYLL